MNGITEDKLKQRYGDEIGTALFGRLSESLGDLTSVTLIEAALDMYAKQLAQSMGRELVIDRAGEMPPAISGDQLAAIIGALGARRDRGMER